MRAIFFIIITLLSIDHISGQADFDCGLSDPVCQLSDLNGVYMNPIYSDQNPFFNTPICNGNIRISNAIWFSFVAPSTSISFNVSNINCDLPTPQIAGCSSACLKIGFWSDCDATCFNLENPECYNSTIITTNNFFDIGNRYYLIIDGVCGSVCSFKLDVNANQTNSLEIPNCNEVAIDVVAEDPFCINNGANNVCIGSKVGIKATGSNGFMNMEDLSQAAWSWEVTGPANVLWTEPLSSRSGDGQDITYGSVDFDSEKGGNEFEIIFQEAGIYTICLLDYQTYCDSFSGCDGSLCVEVDVQDCANYVHPDYDQLIDLYTSTNGGSWTNNDGWKDGSEGTSCDPCNYNGGTWYGIECESDRVVCIDLSGNTNCNIASGLIGNNLDGELVELDLDSLEVLNLSSNNLAGVIPDLSNLRKLRGINLVENSLTGPVPSFDNNTLIVSVNLANNALDGVIPPFNSTPQLEEYDVGINNITGNIPVLDNVPNIRIFKCGENQLFGTIPPLQDLKNLTIFNCINNQLTGRIPNIVDLPNLISLNFGQNDFTDDFPSMEDLPSLVLFICTENNITGSIPDLSNFPSLATFMCNGNNLNGCYPDAVCNIGQFISLGNPLLPWKGNHNPFCNGEEQIGAPCDDNDPLTTNDQIQDDCSCSGDSQDCTHPDYAGLMELYNSTIGENWTINDGWKEGAEGTSCDPCNWNGRSWYGIECENDRVVRIDLSNNTAGNNLRGFLPNLNLNRLEWLCLSFNMIGGDIPDFRLSNQIQKLRISSNNLTGIIPNFDSLLNLNTLRVNNNILTGEIPDFDHLKNLNSFWCLNNSLTGSIPNFEGLDSLQNIDVSNNNLSGDIPDLSTLRNFEVLWCSNNQLTGCFPDYICNLSIFDSKNNPALPNQGDHIPFCNGEEQIGAPCDDNNPLTQNDTIQNDCSCSGTTTTPDDQISGCEIVPQCNLSDIDGATFLTPNYSTQNPQFGKPLCMGTELIENALAFPFVAGNTSLDITITVTNCELPTNPPCNSEGVAVALWTDCTGSCEGEMVTIPNNGSNEVTLSNLIIGNPYYLIIDGSCGAICTIELDVTVSDWTFDIPNANDITVISSLDLRAGCGEIAPNTYCPGQEVFFTAEGDNGVFDMEDVGAEYTWTIDGPSPETVVWDAVIQNGTGSDIQYGSSELDSIPGENVVSMIFDEEGTYEICLTDVSTYCDPSIGGQVCHTITITYLPEQDFGEYDLCVLDLSASGAGFIPPTFTDPTSGVNYEWDDGNPIDLSEIIASDGNIVIEFVVGCCPLRQMIQINLVGSIDPGVVEIPLYDCQIPYTYNVNGESIIIDDIESFSNYNEQLFGASDTQDYNGNNCDSLIIINAVTIELADSIIVETTPNGISIFLDIYRTDGEDFELIDANYTWRDTLTGLVVGTGNPVILPSGLHYCVYDGLVLDVLTGDEVPCSGILGSYIILNDIEDCIIDLQDDIISSNANELIEINILDNDIFPNEYDIQLVGSNLPAIDSIDLDNSGNLSLILNNDFSEQLTLSYEVCSPDCIECETADIIIRNAILENLIFTNVISPDNDGQNDILRFNTDDVIPDSKITIYNRWGDAIYSEENYTNEWNAEGYPGGIYFYVLEVNGIIIKKTLTVLK